MRSKLNRRIQVAFTLFASIASHAQSQPAAEWHQILSSAEDFSVTVPAGYVINKDATGQTTLIGSAGDASFEVGMLKTSYAKEWFKAKREVLPKKGETFESRIDDSMARRYTYQGSNIFRIAIWLATKKGSYKIDLSAPSAQSEGLARIMASIRLKGDPIITSSKVQAPIANAVFKIDGLKSGDIIKAAMERKQTEAIKVEIAPATHEPEDDIVYSRPVILAYRPRPAYTDRARLENVQGTILARVLFKGNGNIGKVTIIKGLPSGLNEQVLQAVRGIKFVPAEVNGIRVDAERTIEYTFEIY